MSSLRRNRRNRQLIVKVCYAGENHERNVYKENDRFKCFFCSKEFSLPHSLQRHAKNGTCMAESEDSDYLAPEESAVSPSTTASSFPENASNSTFTSSTSDEIIESDSLSSSSNSSNVMDESDDSISSTTNSISESNLSVNDSDTDFPVHAIND